VTDILKCCSLGLKSVFSYNPALMHKLREGSDSSSFSHASGIYTVLKSATLRSEIVLRPWHLADGQQATKPVHCSEDR